MPPRRTLPTIFSLLVFVFCVAGCSSSSIFIYDPPTWDDTVGIKSAVAGDGEVTITWGTATDDIHPRVTYLLYIDTDPNPFNRVDLGGHEYGDRENRVEVFCDYAYVLSKDNLTILDVNDPSNPVTVDLFDTVSKDVVDVEVYDRYAYVAYNTSGFYIYRLW